MKTARIEFIEFEDSDLDRLVEMRSDPAVNRFLGGAKAADRMWNKKRLEFYISCYPSGIGQRKMIWRESGEIIGWSGLQPLEGGDEIEISYGMIQSFWGRGIGSEAAEMWLSYGFEEQKLERIVAVTIRENVGSRKIMEKMGMTFEHEDEFYNMPCLKYGIDREDWLNR